MKTELMDKVPAGALLASAHARQEEMLRFIRALVETESPSLEKAAVDRCGALLADTLSAVGGRVRVHKRSEAGNIVQADFIPSNKRKGEKPILLLGHFDTVWESGTLRTMPYREQRGLIYGPGIYDMKAGIAIALYALGALIDTGGIDRPITVLLNTDEELHSDHSRALIEQTAKKCAAVLVFEPSADNGAVKTARKGVGEYDVRVTGIAAHAGLNFVGGANALVELAKQIEEISKFTDLKRGMTVSVGMARGGTRPNVVPAHAEAVVDVRVARAKDADRLRKLFRGLKPFNNKCKLEITGGINRLPLERTGKVVGLYKKAREVASELGFKLDEAAVGGGSDGNFTAALGIPTLDGLGAVGDGAHALHEHIVVSELPRRVALAAGLIRRI